MIEVTDEMVKLALDVFLETPTDNIAQIDAGMRGALATVFGVVERDHEVRRLTPTVGREHASADEYGIVRCHTPGPDGSRCERTPEHRGMHAFYGDDGRPDGPGELVRW